jgi:2-aminoadipate transaminase
LCPKLLQAKQAADLHTPGFNQRVVHEVIRNGFLRKHVPLIRARYGAQRDAMAAALQAHMPKGCQWQVPAGGMFFWLSLPAGTDTVALLHRAVTRGVAFVPGAAFFANAPQLNTLRLSFVTVPPPQIEEGVCVLAKVLKESVEGV